MQTNVAGTLREQLLKCPLYISRGLSKYTKNVLLVTSKNAVAEAISYIGSTCHDVKICGIILFPDCKKAVIPAVHIESDAGKFIIPVLDYEDIIDYPDARVLVYLEDPASPQASNNHFAAIRTLAGIVESFAIYPEIPNTLWYTHPQPDFFRNNSRKLEYSYEAFSDAESKAAMASMIKGIITGDPGFIKLPTHRNYRFPLTWIRQGDIVIDGGISERLLEVVAFAQAAAPNGKVYAFEPEPSFFQQLIKEHSNCELKDLISLQNFGLSSVQGSAHITANAGGSRVVSQQNENTATCRLIDVDSFVREHNIPRIDVIKLDIEGSEAECLHGAQQTLRKWKPRLMISTYHNSYQDLLHLPGIIKQYVPEYKLYLLNHFPNFSETVIYAIVEP